MEKPIVKNKNPAPIQITAEQIIREANDRKEATFTVPGAPIGEERIHDQVDLLEFRWRKRKQFEDSLRMNKINFGTWIRYAQFEESQGEYQNARSVFERALVIEHRNQSLWMRYAEMEMKAGFVNHARNVFDRAVTLLPRVDQFWYKYAYMEETLGNLGGARQIFERWLSWEPSEEAYLLYIKFEKRYKEKARIREIYRRFVTVHPDVQNWLKWTRFEENELEYENARAIYQAAIDALGPEHSTAHLFVSFARFEAKLKEFDRARAIFHYALKFLPIEQTDLIQQQLALFEKQYGTKGEIEESIFKKRRALYEAEVGSNPYNYDGWFDLVRLEETVVESTNGDAEAIEKCRDTYERAISKVPLIQEKRYWRRYIYLWVYYAIFEELVTKDVSRARDIYSKCISIIPHRTFTFAKIWILFAKFEIRQMNLTSARKTLGRSVGMCPKGKLFKGYIELELQLREFDRCRILYQQYLKFLPSNVYAWIKFAELEKLLDDLDRARGIFEIAIGQPLLDMPELLWKAYIDFEYGEGEWDKVRALYRRLLDRTKHPRVWKSFAEFELLIKEDNDESEEDSFIRARSIMEEGYQYCKTSHVPKEERKMMLTYLLEFEEDNYKTDGTFQCENKIAQLKSKVPQIVKRRRLIYPEDPNDFSTEEVLEYVFPEDEEAEKSKGGAQGGVSKLLAMARQWKESQEQQQEKQ